MNVKITLEENMKKKSKENIENGEGKFFQSV